MPARAQPATPLLFAAIKFYRPTDAYKFGALSQWLAAHIYVPRPAPPRPASSPLAMCRIRNMPNTSPDLKPEAKAESESESESESEAETEAKAEAESEAESEYESGIRACA